MSLKKIIGWLKYFYQVNVLAVFSFVVYCHIFNLYAHDFFNVQLSTCIKYVSQQAHL